MKKIVIIAGISIIIVVIVVILAFLFLFPSADASRFHGSWKQSISGFDTTGSSSETYWTFTEDGTLIQTDITTSFEEDTPLIELEDNDEENYFTVISLGPKKIQQGSYEINGNKLSYSGIGEEIPFSLEYNFINDNQFTLNFLMVEMTFTKVTEDEIPDPGYAFNDIDWSNINISVSAGFEEDTNWDNIQLTRSSTPYSGESCPADWGKVQVGDVVEFGSYESEHISGDLNWVPSDNQIAWFSFWVFE